MALGSLDNATQWKIEILLHILDSFSSHWFYSHHFQTFPLLETIFESLFQFFQKTIPLVANWRQVKGDLELSNKKVKISPIYDPYVGECLLERTLVLGHQLCDIGWPVPFLAALSPQCSHWIPIRCWMESRQAL